MAWLWRPEKRLGSVRNALPIREWSPCFTPPYEWSPCFTPIHLPIPPSLPLSLARSLGRSVVRSPRVCVAWSDRCSRSNPSVTHSITKEGFGAGIGRTVSSTGIGARCREYGRDCCSGSSGSVVRWPRATSGAWRRWRSSWRRSVSRSIRCVATSRDRFFVCPFVCLSPAMLCRGMPCCRYTVATRCLF